MWKFTSQERKEVNFVKSIKLIISRSKAIFTLVVSSLIYLTSFYFLYKYQIRRRVSIENDELIVNYKNSNLVYDYNDKASKSLLKDDLNSENDEDWFFQKNMFIRRRRKKLY